MLPLRTDRLEIDLLGVDDAADFAAYRGIPEVTAYQSWTPDFSVHDARRLVEGQQSAPVPPMEPEHWVQLAVRARGVGSLLGDVAIGRDAQPGTFEVGVTFAPAHHGRGYATEAVAAVVDGLFEIAGAHRVIAHADERNHAVRGAPAASRFPARVARRRGRLVQGGVDDARHLRPARPGRTPPAVTAASDVRNSAHSCAESPLPD